MKTKPKTKRVKAWAVMDVENIGVKRQSPALFQDIEGRFHILKTRTDAVSYIHKQFFPAHDMGWRVKPITITYQLPTKLKGKR